MLVGERGSPKCLDTVHVTRDVRMNGKSTWRRLQQEVIDAGICTHCGACVGLSAGTLQMVQTERGPLPAPANGREPQLPPLAYAACPGKGINYPAAYRTLFGALPENWLIGCHRQVFVGHATDRVVRRQGASGGVITQTLLYLLEEGHIDGAVVLQQGRPEPWLAEPIIARSREELQAASQSVYTPAPVNTILEEMSRFDGRLAYVGLPDQVAALRCLQDAGHAGAQRVDYVLGPYVGTAIYLDAIKSYLRANGIDDLRQVAELRYREGEWPGYLQIRTRSGRILRAQKFYYNYLIPFYITQASLQAVDFTNELTDISVGDAWHPRYEKQGAGFSVVVARSARAEELLQEMAAAGIVALEPTPVAEALSMHGHMLDFKKRGAFIRNEWRRRRGRRAPLYGYRPAQIPLIRRMVEGIIVLLFALGRTEWARRLVEHIPLPLIGRLFDVLRKTWKRLSRPVKRKGLTKMTFIVEETRNNSKPMANGSQALDGREMIKRIEREIGHWRRSSWSFAALEEYFDGLAADYDQINERADSYYRRFVDAMRLADVPDDAYMLDVCARTGNGTAYFYEHGKVRRAVCADVSREMGRLCEERLRAVGFEDYEWVQLRSYNWPFPDNSFEVVLSLESVEHFDRPDLFIGELGRVTRPGGTMILSTPNVLWEPLHALAAVAGLHHSEGPHHFVPYRQLRQMISTAGFQVENAETTVLVPAGPDWLLRWGIWVEERTRESLMPLLGLRHLLVCRKLP